SGRANSTPRLFRAEASFRRLVWCALGGRLAEQLKVLPASEHLRRLVLLLSRAHIRQPLAAAIGQVAQHGLEFLPAGRTATVFLQEAVEEREPCSGRRSVAGRRLPLTFLLEQPPLGEQEVAHNVPERIDAGSWRFAGIVHGLNLRCGESGSGRQAGPSA